MADTFTWASRRHNSRRHKLKAGFDFQFDRIRNSFPGLFGGSYVFPTLASFARGRPDIYRQSFAGPGTTGAETAPDIQEYSAFLEDEWRVAYDLTLNLGLRYDLMKIAAPPARNPDPQLAAADIDTGRFDPDVNNFGPRIGVAWNPRGARYVIRGGAGVFYGRTPSIMLAAAGGNNGINVVSLTFRGAEMPAYPQKFSDIPSGGTASTPSIVFIDKDFANPRLLHANTAFEWEAFRGTTLAVTYLFVDGVTLPRSIDRNIGSPGLTTFTIAESGETVTYARFGSDRPFSGFDRVVALESTAESRYNGLTIELNRRFAKDTHVRVAYTLSRLVDTVPDATALIPGNIGDDAKYASNPVNFDVDRTVGNQDEPHRLVASGVYMTRHAASRLKGVARAVADGWTFAAIFTAQSGQPFLRVSRRTSIMMATAATTSLRARDGISFGCPLSSPSIRASRATFRSGAVPGCN